MLLESNTKLPLVQDELHTYLVAFDEVIFEKTGENEGDPEMTLYSYDGVRIEKPLTYDKVVDAIITDRYDASRMMAIVNNHLLNDGNAEHEAEYNDMQNWRAHAKEIAKQVMRY